jgi:hypothetical protein
VNGWGTGQGLTRCLTHVSGEVTSRMDALPRNGVARNSVPPDTRQPRRAPLLSGLSPVHRRRGVEADRRAEAGAASKGLGPVGAAREGGPDPAMKMMNFHELLAAPTGSEQPLLGRGQGWQGRPGRYFLAPRDLANPGRCSEEGTGPRSTPRGWTAWMDPLCACRARVTRCR